MAQDPERRHMNESFRPDEKGERSYRPSGDSRKPGASPEPIDIGGPSILDKPEKKPPAK